MRKAQLEVLFENREETLRMIADATVNRTTFLKHFQCSTSALYNFMILEGVSWSRKKHNGNNQFSKTSIKLDKEVRVKIEAGEKVGDRAFKGDSSLFTNTGIYRIVSASGGIYIGMASINFRRRFVSHRTQLNSNSHHCKGLQRELSITIQIVSSKL